MLSDHLRRLLAVVESCPAVDAFDLSLDKRGPQAGFIRGDVTFRDGSVLHVRELVKAAGKRTERLSYSYHYQEAEGALIFRYDDTPHFPALDRFPHHRHTAPAGVVPSDAPPLADVIEEIESLLNP